MAPHGTLHPTDVKSPTFLAVSDLSKAFLDAGRAKACRPETDHSVERLRKSMKFMVGYPRQRPTCTLHSSRDESPLRGPIRGCQPTGPAILIGGCDLQHGHSGQLPRRSLLQHCHCTALPATIAIPRGIKAFAAPHRRQCLHSKVDTLLNSLHCFPRKA